MTTAQRSALDDQIDEITTAFALKLHGMATGTFIREGLVKEAMNSLIWEIYHAMPDQRVALAEALEQMDGIIRVAIERDAEEERTAAAARDGSAASPA